MDNRQELNNINNVIDKGQLELTIKSVSIPTLKEIQEIQKSCPGMVKIDLPYWTKTSVAPGNKVFVICDSNIITELARETEVNSDNIGVRPIIYLEDPEKINLKTDMVLCINETKWIYVGNNHLLCETYIGKEYYRYYRIDNSKIIDSCIDKNGESIYDTSKLNDYVDSDIRNYIGAFMKRNQLLSRNRIIIKWSPEQQEKYLECIIKPQLYSSQEKELGSLLRELGKSAKNNGFGHGGLGDD